jgi:eukaryotic-like serine/threonine-protein kinase
VEIKGFEPGTVLGGVYRLVRELGHGSMGVIFLAEDLTLERNVGIKVVWPHLLNETLRHRFLTEVRAMARVNHKNVLAIYTIGEHEGAPYFVSEFVDGVSLEVWLKEVTQEGRSPDVDLALRIFDETCEGVAAIHAAKTVHRDLKPSNILLDKQFRVRVADLGVANVLMQMKPAGIEPSDGRDTADLDVVGTPAYMAPEVAFHRDSDPDLLPRADVYSLGCVAYELFTGQKLFEAEGAAALMFRHATEKPEAPSERRPGLGTLFDKAILHALAKDPRERTRSVEGFRFEMATAKSQGSEPVRILVAEDDADFREALGIRLRKEFPSADVECVADGAAALAAFEKQAPSVLIVDLRMPIMDGLELTKRLRANEGTSQMPILVVTASGGPDEWKELSAVGADGFLVKPVNMTDVVTLVRRALAERMSGKETP